MVDPATGAVAEVWRRYFLAVGAAATVTNAPTNAQYLTATSNGDLTAERNLGLLASGYLKIAVALGIATPSTVTAIPAADLSGTIPDARFPATLPAISGANLTGIIVPGVSVTHASVVKVFADSPYAVVASDETIRANAVGGAMTITLPATPTLGRRLTVKKIDASANAVTVAGGGPTIDGAANRALAVQWNFCTVEGDGTTWLVVATG
jgi:hypothetical protein